MAVAPLPAEQRRAGKWRRGRDLSERPRVSSVLSDDFHPHLKNRSELSLPPASDVLVDSDVSDLISSSEVTRNLAVHGFPMKGRTMNGRSRMFLWLLAVAIVSVITFGQSAAFAQSADPQGAGASPTLIRSFALFGGSFQEADTGSAACTGQRLFSNVFTGSCACQNGFTEVPSARILVDVGQGQNVAQCGSTLIFCLK
jgi:hypothetical protein